MTAGVVVSRNALIEAVRAHLLKRPVQMQKEEALPSM
jgi:seryl-tRNA(Sec) selenium transferase